MTTELVLRFEDITPETQDDAPGRALRYRVQLAQRVHSRIAPGPHSKTRRLDATFAITEAELAEFEKLMTDTGTSDIELQKAGERLYAMLPETIRAALQTQLHTLGKSLLLDLPRGLIDHIPWEILFWPKPTFSTTIQVPIVSAHHLTRVSAPDWNAVAPPVKGPLRVLIASGIPIAPGTSAEKEIQEIRHGVQLMQRTIDIETIAPASKAELYEKIKEFMPNVFHFIGHGDNEPPRLKFANGDWKWSHAEIAADIGGPNLHDWKPQLVFLNSCLGATRGVPGGSVAAAFLDGARSVISMQGSINADLAPLLAARFYQAIARGFEIHEAVTEARNAIGTVGRPGGKQAAFVVHQSRCSPLGVLPAFLHFDADAEYNRGASICPLLRSMKTFVNQTDPRRKLCGHFWPVEQTRLQQQFVLVRGDARHGKSLLCAWLLDLGLRSGHRVRYVRLNADSGGVSCGKVLELIWNDKSAGATPSPLCRPLANLPAALAQALAREPLESASFAAFRQALAAEAREMPVTIVLDQFSQRMDDGGFWSLWEHLFVPVANGAVPGVNLMVVLGQDDYAMYKVEERLQSRPEFRISTNDVFVKPMNADEFRERFLDYVHFRDPNGDAWARDLVKHIPSSGQSFPIYSLEEMFAAVAAVIRR